MASWIELLESANTLTAPVVDELVDKHGDRAERAVTAVSEGRVKEYNDFIVVVGHEEEYIIENMQCACPDTKYNLDLDDPDELCWHAIAVRIATTIDAVESHDIWYTDVWDGL